MNAKTLQKLAKKAQKLGIDFLDLRDLLTNKAYLVRHADTCFNGSDEKIRSIVDLPLSDDGLLNANDTGIQLVNMNIECIYTSDMKRAKQTARAIQLNTGAKIEILPELRAWNLGSLAGKTSTDVKDIIDGLVANPTTLPPDSRESYKQLVDRTLTGYYKSKEFDGNVAIITHQSNCMIILEHLKINEQLDPGNFIKL